MPITLITFILHHILSEVCYEMREILFDLFPTHTGYKEMSPREALTGIKVDVKTCAGICFGELAYVGGEMKVHQSKSMEPRVFPGFALLPTVYHGSCLFLNLETMETVVRDQYIIQDISQDSFDHMYVHA